MAEIIFTAEVAVAPTPSGKFRVTSVNGRSPSAELAKREFATAEEAVEAAKGSAVLERKPSQET